MGASAPTQELQPDSVSLFAFLCAIDKNCFRGGDLLFISVMFFKSPKLSGISLFFLDRNNSAALQNKGLVCLQIALSIT